MKKLFSSAFLLFFTCIIYAQVLPDTAAIRATLNQWIVPNGSITATKLNVLLNSMNRQFTPGAVFNVYASNDSLYMNKGGVISFVGKVGGSGGGGTTDSLVFSTIARLSNTVSMLNTSINLRKLNSDSVGVAGYTTLAQLTKTRDSLLALINIINSGKYNEIFTGSTSSTITTSVNYTTGSIRLYKNGIRVSSFSEATSNTITLSLARLTGDIYTADYQTAPLSGSKYNQYFTGSASTTITLADPYKANSVVVWKNGIRINDFTQATASTITLNSTRLSGDIYTIDYNY